MADREAFRAHHPHLCDPSQVRVPGLMVPKTEGGVQVKDWREVLGMVTPPPLPPKVQNFRPTPKAAAAGPTFRDFMGQGNEGAVFYLSYRLRPEAWGVYISGKGLEVITGEIERLTVRGFPEARAVEPEALGEFAFHLAFDFLLGHAKFHAAVDDVAADEELARQKPLYGPYLQGPYSRTLAQTTPAEVNLEEALANVVGLRIFLNPGGIIELGGPVEKGLNQDDAFRWNSYLMSGVLAAEFIFLLRILPPGYKDFLAFLGKRTEVTAYAHMGIQYNLNQEEFNRGLQRLADLLTGEPGSLEAQKFTRVVPTPLYIY